MLPESEVNILLEEFHSCRRHGVPLLTKVLNNLLAHFVVTKLKICFKTRIYVLLFRLLRIYHCVSARALVMWIYLIY